MPWYRSIWQYLKTYFTIVGFAVTMMGLLTFTLIVLAIVYSPMKQNATNVIADVIDANEFVIELDLNGQLVLNQPHFATYFEEFLSETEFISISELGRIFRKAGSDKRVLGARIIINSIGGGTAEVEGLRRVIKDFAKIKHVEVVLRNVDNSNYFLASAGNTITLTPAAGIMMPGPTFDLIYFGEALRKLGVDLEVVKAGKYKSAFEPFIKDEPSEPTLEQYRSMESHLRNYAIREVALGRGVTEDKVRSWYAQSIFTAEEALSAGIVDRVEHYEKINQVQATDDINTKLRALKAVGYKTYRSSAGSLPDTMEEAGGNEGVALIEALGEIVMNDMGNGNIFPKKIKKQVEWAIKDDSVKAIVLRIDSPGGSALASEIMWHDLNELAFNKPVVVSMGNVAASGGYYIAAPGKLIMAEPTTITGSIGVISMIPNAKMFGEKYGVHFYSVTQSDRKALLDLGSESTDEDRRLLEGSTDEVYALFKQRVSTGRGLSIEAVEALAQGRVYTGEEALELGLVDALGGLREAFSEAKKLAGLDENKLYPVYTYKEKIFDIRECFRRPSKMMKCIMEADTGVSAKNFGRAVKSSVQGTIQAQAMKSRVGRIHARVNSWLETIDREGALALWPQYYSIAR